MENQVFDILPVRGTLLPGESENVEFVFHSQVDHKFLATALCAVSGGEILTNHFFEPAKFLQNYNSLI